MNATSCSAILRNTAVGLAAAALLAAPAAAQDYRFALGVGGGWSNHENLTPRLATSTTPEAGWLGAAQMELWPGSARVGLRLGGGYAVRALEEDPGSTHSMMTGDLSLLVRLLPAGRDRWVAPYLTLGGGAIRYFAQDGAAPIGGGAWGDDPVIRAMGLAGGGLDLFPSRHVGVRLEAVDRIVFPSLGEAPETFGVPGVHGLEVTAMLQLRAARVSRPVVLAALPAPSEPAPAAAPAGPTAEEREAAEMEARLDDWQGQLAALSTRVDSLERAMEQRSGPALLGVRSASVSAGVVAAPAQPTFDRDAELWTVQVGAFVEEATARMWEDRLRRRNLPVWVTDAVVRGLKVKRVRVGALPTQREANGLARELRVRFGWPTWVDRVAEADVVPADAIAATRSFLRAN